MERSRSQASKKVIGIDGFFKGAMSILYQVPYGQPKKDQANASADGLHVFLTVQCADSVLVVYPAFSEHSRYQLKAIKEALGKDGAAEMENYLFR